MQDRGVVDGRKFVGLAVFQSLVVQDIGRIVIVSVVYGASICCRQQAPSCDRFSKRQSYRADMSCHVGTLVLYICVVEVVAFNVIVGVFLVEPILV